MFFPLVDQSESLDYVYLNQIAQGVKPFDASVAAFREMTPTERSDSIHRLSLMVHQSHPLPQEVVDAISTSGLKPTFTPCVMLTTGNFDQQLSGVRQLPDDELDKVFVLLLHLFRIADGRRREACGGSCHHWWHQDLSNDRVLAALESNGGA